MATVLITGANRGLGLEFCKQYAAEGWQVLACCRMPQAAAELASLAERYPHVSVFALDVANLVQIEQLAAQLHDTCIDVLINNAGVYGDSHEQGFGQLDYESWTKTLAVNVQAPVKMAEAFLPHLKRGDKKLLVSISSLMGSIADNSSGGSIIYRSSKAALNAAMKSIAIDLKEQAVSVLIFHPGWVRTDMGGPNGLIEANESVAGMRKIISEFTPEQSGSFVKYDGTPLPW
ncbi:MAG: SDR family oxidoreductase [Methylococcales bacterium]|nr:SDR family oxidoreductase [Methylococcales bacterium]